MYSKFISSKVDILLAPYNYILSENIRKRMNINIDNRIIIFDEAHNIENSSEQAMTLKLSEQDLLATQKILY